MKCQKSLLFQETHILRQVLLQEVTRKIIYRQKNSPELYDMRAEKGQPYVEL